MEDNEKSAPPTPDPNQDLRDQFHKILEQYLEGACTEEEVFNAFIHRLMCEVNVSHQKVRDLTIERLREQGEPTECGRCGGRPGEPGCGKIIHEIMLVIYEQIQREQAGKQ